MNRNIDDKDKDDDRHDDDDDEGYFPSIILQEKENTFMFRSQPRPCQINSDLANSDDT